MKKFTHCITGVLLFALLFTGYAYASPNNEISQEEQAISSLMDMSKDDFWISINKVFADYSLSMTQSDIILWGEVLYERIAEYSKSEILDAIFDTNRDPFFRATLVQLIGESNLKESKDTDLHLLLLAENTPDVLRHAILLNADFSTNAALDSLRSIVHKDGLDSFYALRSLSYYDHNSAYSYASEILRNYANEDIEKVKGSIFVYADHYRNEVIASNVSDVNSENAALLFDACQAILSKSEDQRLTDYIVSVLSSMNNPTALSLVVYDEHVDNIMKAFSISQNDRTLIEMLNNDPSDDDITLANTCMGLYPIEAVESTLATTTDSRDGLRTEKSAISNTLSVAAASGYQGYAIYRDGVQPVNDWHAAILESPNSSQYALPTVMAYGFGQPTSYYSWNVFLSNCNFTGVYGARNGGSAAQMDMVVATARSLVSYNIPYTVTQQMSATNRLSNSKYQPSEITALRCDGVIEYCYEYNGMSIFSVDISNKQNNLTIHSGTAITPKSQAQTYMYLWSTQRP